MNREEAIAALNYEDQCPEITVETRSGARYTVAWDTLETQENGYVYGYRINGSIGPFARGQKNGAIRWFDLKNVELVK